MIFGPFWNFVVLGLTATLFMKLGEQRATKRRDEEDRAEVQRRVWAEQVLSRSRWVVLRRAHRVEQGWSSARCRERPNCAIYPLPPEYRRQRRDRRPS